MKHLVRLIFLFLLCMVAFASSDAQWREVYATYDNDANGTGSNVFSAGVIHKNTFVALISNSTECFMVPYVNADSAVGRKNFFGYGSAATGVFQDWNDGFLSTIPLHLATKIVARPDSTLYVANNDDNHNILVFRFTGDTIAADPNYRQETGSNTIFGLGLDASGYVYVCNDTTTGQTEDVKIYKPLAQWTEGHADPPVKTIDLPDGVYRGIAVSPDGSQLFVADYTNRKVLKYTGSPTTGYTKVPSFDFSIKDSISETGRLPGPVHMKYLSPNNILFVVAGICRGHAGQDYSYGKIFLVNPNTGAMVSNDTLVSVINVAQWNLDKLGSYTGRGDGTASGLASGYTSTFDVDFDENGSLYSQSYYGWTVEKWQYNGNLPTLTGIQEVSRAVPESYTLAQNFPNPFNPSTTISFTIPEGGMTKVRVYDLLGREVATLVNEYLLPGTYKTQFAASQFGSGTYVYTLTSGNFHVSRKMLLVK